MATPRMGHFRPPLATFVLPLIGAFAGIFGLLIGSTRNEAAYTWLEAFTDIALGVVLGIALTLAISKFARSKWQAVLFGLVLGVVIGFILEDFHGMVFGAVMGALMARVAFWLETGEYRASLPPYANKVEVLWYHTLRWGICGFVFLFLIAPILIIIPLSFNQEPYFTFTKEMLALKPSAYSLRWYLDIFENGMVDPNLPIFSWAWIVDSWNNGQWIHATKNSWFIAICATALATGLGTIAALGLSQSHMPARNLIMSLLISPMIVPLVITAAGLFFFYSDIGLAGTYLGIIMAHAVLGTPFVVITVTATLVGFDRSLIRAGQMMGARPHTVFFKVIMPLILPGVISGALFAFITSFDEVVAVIFLANYDQRTIPRQMWSGIREQISPTILAVATILVVISIMLLTMVELLRRRSERLRGMTPQ